MTVAITITDNNILFYKETQLETIYVPKNTVIFLISENHSNTPLYRARVWHRKGDHFRMPRMRFHFCLSFSQPIPETKDSNIEIKNGPR